MCSNTRLSSSGSSAVIGLFCPLPAALSRSVISFVLTPRSFASALILYLSAGVAIAVTNPFSLNYDACTNPWNRFPTPAGTLRRSRRPETPRRTGCRRRRARPSRFARVSGCCAGGLVMRAFVAHPLARVFRRIGGQQHKLRPARPHGFDRQGRAPTASFPAFRARLMRPKPLSAVLIAKPPMRRKSPARPAPKTPFPAAVPSAPASDSHPAGRYTRRGPGFFPEGSSETPPALSRTTRMSSAFGFICPQPTHLRSGMRFSFIACAPAFAITLPPTVLPRRAASGRP